jgi:hypothetical protein
VFEAWQAAAKANIDSMNAVAVDYNEALMARDRQIALVAYNMADLDDLAQVGEGCSLEEVSICPLLYIESAIEQ